jgi:small multidrug resistance pump
MSPMFLLLLAIIAEVVGTTALRASEGFTRVVPSIIVVIGYAVAFYLMSLTLKQISIGVAYAIWSGVGTALTVVVGVLLFHESLDAARVIGIALIILGVLVLNLFSNVHTTGT